MSGLKLGIDDMPCDFLEPSQTDEAYQSDDCFPIDYPDSNIKGHDKALIRVMSCAEM